MLCICLLSCKDECWFCARSDIKTGFFFNKGDTLRYAFIDQFDAYKYLRDSLQSKGYSEHKIINVPLYYIETCNKYLKNEYQEKGFICAEK